MSTKRLCEHLLWEHLCPTCKPTAASESALSDLLCCDYFEIGMKKINAPIVLQAARCGGIGYDGRLFKYCPWCGSAINMGKIDMNDEEKTESALAVCDVMAETWAEEIELDAMISKITKCERSREKIKELMMQAHVEGLYRGRTSVVNT